MEKITREVAELDILAWLDKKKVLQSTRETYKKSIDTLIDAVTEGILAYNHETGVLTHTLLFPLNAEKENSASVVKLEYRPRLNDNLLRPYLKGVAADDGDMRLNAHIAALTEKPRGIISLLDTGDKKIAESIAIFFL